MDFDVIAIISANQKRFAEVLHLRKLLACDLPVSAQVVGVACGTIVTDWSTRACASSTSSTSPAGLSGGQAPGKLDVPTRIGGKMYWMIFELAHAAYAC